MQVSSLRFSVGLGSLLAVLILGSVYAAFIPLGDDNALNDELPPRDIVGETQLHCVALAIYFEGGSTFESEEGQRHIARVVVERAKANLRKWGGSDLCDVVFYKKAGVCQFSFACLPLARRTPRPGKLWDQALAYATDELEGRSTILEDSIRYYMNPALTSDRNACRFRKEFVPLFESGRHQFFREPDEDERRMLASSEPEECKRYKAALELKKRMAKAAAEKRRKAQAAKLKSKRSKYARR
jgi:cell wall hydrolase